MNFGGVHRANNQPHHLTGLKLVLDGFNATTSEYLPTGAVLLVNDKGEVAAGWSFAKLMDHWKEKHAQAAFVPVQQILVPSRRYRYGRHILLGEGAEFKLLLEAFNDGKVYYDPGIKLENAFSAESKGKKRSQFRVNSADLSSLYAKSRIVDTCNASSASN